MEDTVGLLLMVTAALVLSIIALAKLAGLKAGIQELKRTVADLETRGQARASEPAKTAVPPPLPEFLRPPPAPAPSATAPKKSAAAPINWEAFLGVKLFAWIGGFAFFLGVVFFVKYAFENNWITPVMRVVAGGATGIVLIALSVFPAIRRYRIPAQSLCATGILILYADIYGAYSFYRLIPLTSASALMWIVTAVALFLASWLNAQSAVILGLIGGFLTPLLFRAGYTNPVSLFGYVALLNFAVMGVSAVKRWHYLLLLAALGSVLTEFIWAAHGFGPLQPANTRIVFIGIEAQFLAICLAYRATKIEENWSVGATALSGFAVFLFCLANIENTSRYHWEFLLPMVFLSSAGLIALASAVQSLKHREIVAAMIATSLVFSWIIEWMAFARMAGSDQPGLVFAWYIVFFLLFAATPYFCGADRLWPWVISAMAGPLQFWFCYQLMETRFPNAYEGLLPVAFALPAAGGLFYLVKKQKIALASGDSRLASQGAAVLAFVSLIFPVQFEREWITLGWAIEGVALILLFRVIPNGRLRAAALIVLCAAFIRLAFNPAVLEYHPRTRVAILNWYLYAFGIAAVCFFLGARWFDDPKQKQYERAAGPLLYWLCGATVFLLMNIEIADYFSIGPTLTFSFSGNFARDMTYTIAWSLFAFVLLVTGITRNVRAVRLVGIGLLCAAFAKLFLHDLDSLNQLYRIGAFITVAAIAIVASFVYQRFLSPGAKKA